MLIARLLDALFDRRVVLVVTSNYPPHELLPNPLFHDRFVPTIERILVHMEVVSVDGPIDYRALNSRNDSRGGFAAGQYIVDPGQCTLRGAEAAVSCGAENPDAVRKTSLPSRYSSAHGDCAPLPPTTPLSSTSPICAVSRPPRPIMSNSPNVFSAGESEISRC